MTELMDLISCPVCTLYLRKGMTLTEHLETHPKEQVIRALVSLATSETKQKDEKLDFNETESNSTNTVVQTTSIATNSQQSVQSQPPSFISSSIEQSPTIILQPSSQTSGSSTITSGPLDTLFAQQQQIFNKDNTLVYQITDQIAIKGPPPPPPPILVSPLNNSASQIQQFFSYKTKQLPPPPAYGQAISQLRSLNNQNKFGNVNNNNSNNISNNNYGRNYVGHIPVAGGSINNANLINNQNISSLSCQPIYNNLSYNQGTLDYSLPKSVGENSTAKQLSHNLRKAINSVGGEHKSQWQQQIPESQKAISFAVTEQPLTLLSHQQQFKTTDILTNENFNKNQIVLNPSTSLFSNHASYTPPPSIMNPMCLVASSKLSSTPIPSPLLQTTISPAPSVLRFGSETQLQCTSSSESSCVSAHYVERENGDFLVQESPRHVVECIEKDDGEFSVIEKVIHSSPSVVQIKSTVEPCDVEDALDESNTDSIDSNDKNDSADVNNMNYKEVNNTIQKSNNITVLSNIKLDPNVSLDLMENINKDGAENFWSGIVNSIKKEESEKQQRYSVTIIDASQIMETEGILNNSMPIPHSSGTTSVIRLAVGCNNNKINSSNTGFPLHAESVSEQAEDHLLQQDDDGVEIANVSTVVDACNNDKNVDVNGNSKNTLKSKLRNGGEVKRQSNMSSTVKQRPFKKQPKKLVVKFKHPPLVNIEQKPLNNDPGPSGIRTDELQNELEKINNILKDHIGVESQQKENGDNDKTESNLTSIDMEIDTDLITDSSTSIIKSEETISKNIIDSDNISNFKNFNNELTDTKLIINADTEIILDNRTTNDTTESTTGYHQPKMNHNFLYKNSKTEYVFAKSFEKTDTIFSIHSLDEDNIEEKIEQQHDGNDSENLNQKDQQEHQLHTTSNTSNATIDLNSTQHHYTDYPFSFLYGSGIEKISSTGSSAGIISEHQTIHTANNVINNNDNLELFNRYHAGDAFNEDCGDEEKSSYLDLDSCKQTNSCSSATIGCSNSNSSCSGGLLSNSSSHDQNSLRLVDAALNIRTDEKMPAKGEISEQESNGDVDNSWSQPVYNELTYKFQNPYDTFVNREDWSLSHDDFFVPHDLSTTTPGRNPKISSIWPTSGSSDNLNSTAFEIKNKSSKKSSTLISSEVIATCSTELHPAPASLSTEVVTGKRKNFQCDHCRMVFSKLKDRNDHMIEIHQYKRIKGTRRLMREAPSATVTSTQVIETEPKIEPNFEPQPLQILQSGNNANESCGIIVKQEQIQLEPINVSPTEDLEEKKPVVGIVSTTSNELQHHPRTKYDSIRANVYRMLMNFNLTVLQGKSEAPIDKSLFDSKSFCCYTCKRDFISVKLFDEHLGEHPAECFTCNKKFSRWTYFSIHLKRHLGWKDFGCTVCDKKFVVRSALVEHVRTHTGATPLKCNICEKSFRRYSNLTQHKKVCHSTKPIRKKEYVCYCGEVLPSKARFFWHKEIHDPKPKCCLWCRDRFVHANSLRRHIRLAHSDKFAYTEPVECPICQGIYAKSSLKGHMATHSMDTQHECAICNKSFSTKWNLKIHSWVHANRAAKPFKCENCTKAFVREIDYKNHMNSHKQIRPYTCEYCGCKFIRKYNYMRHRREHHGQKKFSCDLCGKLFHRHYYLIEHRRIHTGERPFLCTICGKSSTTKTNHNKHLKIHHSRDPFTSET